MGAGRGDRRESWEGGWMVLCSLVARRAGARRSQVCAFYGATWCGGVKVRRTMTVASRWAADAGRGSIRFMRAWIVLLILVLPAVARGHAISMSSGDLNVEGSRADFELRMPLYEIVHLEKPEEALLGNFHVKAGGVEARRVGGSCLADARQDSYNCHAQYEFPAPPERIEVECTFAAVTVPNHVHVLQVKRGEATEQAVFDFSFTRSEINFVPPTEAELAFSHFGAGLARVIGGPVQLLFVAALVLAGRGRGELAAILGAFLAGEILAAMVVEVWMWQPPGRFVEAAAALTVAYLAVEILLLPDAGRRWLVAAGMGVFHGIYFGDFLRRAEMQAGWFLLGVGAAEIGVAVLLGFLLSKIRRAIPGPGPVRVGAVLLLATGLGWFVLRIRG